MDWEGTDWYILQKQKIKGIDCLQSNPMIPYQIRLYFFRLYLSAKPLFSSSEREVM
jgi:hypothetical protein